MRDTWAVFSVSLVGFSADAVSVTDLPGPQAILLFCWRIKVETRTEKIKHTT